MGKRRSFAGAVVLALAACSEPEAPPPPKPGPATYVPPPPTARADLPDVVYVDVTAEAGIEFVHENGSYGKKFLPETMGPGVVVFDADGDAHLDLLFTNGRRWPGHEADYPSPAERPATLRFYRNLGGLEFEDSTVASGLAVEAYAMGGAAADADADGDCDLFVSCVGDNLYFENQGGGRFVEKAREVGLATARWKDRDGREHPSWSVSSAFLDYDRDGWLDLFVASYVQWSEATDVFTTLNGKDKSFTTPELYPGDSSRLYRNLGSGPAAEPGSSTERATEGGRRRFEDVTEAAGILAPGGKALGVAICDVNEDGWPDLAVANDSQPNQLFVSRPRSPEAGGGTRFEDVALSAGIAYDAAGRARAGMGIDVADLEGDGNCTVAIGNFSREPVSFYCEKRDAFFVDDAGQARLAEPTLLYLKFGTLFTDYDLDGRLDLALANGHIEPSIQEIQADIAYKQTPQLFWNRGDGTFAEATAKAGEPFGRPIVGRALAAADLDEDGDPELILTENGGRAAVLRCDRRGAAAENRFVRVKLEGKAPNLVALGASLVGEVDGRRAVRTVRTGSSYLSQSETVATFGLGKAERLSRLTVRWPSGVVTDHSGLEAGRTHVLREPPAP